MNQETRSDPSVPTFWKALVFILGGLLLARLLRLWLSEAVALSIGLFVGFVLFYQTPPYFGGRQAISKTLLWSAAAGVIAFLLTRFA
jgi:hypothetical protein